jgi:hypothetical protein
MKQNSRNFMVSQKEFFFSKPHPKRERESKLMISFVAIYKFNFGLFFYVCV